MTESKQCIRYGCDREALHGKYCFEHTMAELRNNEIIWGQKADELCLINERLTDLRERIAQYTEGASNE